MFALIVFGTFFVLLAIGTILVGKSRNKRIENSENIQKEIIKNICKLKPGMSEQEVLNIMGKPHDLHKYERWIKEKVWFDIYREGYPLVYGYSYTFSDSDWGYPRQTITNRTSSFFVFIYFQGGKIKCILNTRGEEIIDYRGGFARVIDSHNHWY